MRIWTNGETYCVTLPSLDMEEAHNAKACTIFFRMLECESLGFAALFQRFFNSFQLFFTYISLIFSGVISNTFFNTLLIMPDKRKKKKIPQIMIQYTFN